MPTPSSCLQNNIPIHEFHIPDAKFSLIPDTKRSPNALAQHSRLCIIWLTFPILLFCYRSLFPTGLIINPSFTNTSFLNSFLIFWDAVIQDPVKKPLLPGSLSFRSREVISPLYKHQTSVQVTCPILICHLLFSLCTVTSH